MTSELKPCPFCGGEAKSDYTNGIHSVVCLTNGVGCSRRGACYNAAPCSNGGSGKCDYCYKNNVDCKNAIAVWNTRATPSADPLAGLTRFEPDTFREHDGSFGAYMVKGEDGEYVLHSEAAKIIADKDAEIARLKSDRLYIVGCNDGYKAAKAELTQIKAQEPVGYAVYDRTGFRNFHTDIPKISSEDLSEYEITIIPLYAAPVSDSLKADATRYQYLRSRDLESVRKGGIFAGVTPENYVINGIDLDNAIDAFLNVEASNDKG